MTWQRPHWEAKRLAYLRALFLDYQAPPQELAGLVRAAAAITDMPVALLCVMSERGYRVLTNVGMEGVDTVPRAGTFCNHMIATGDQCVIADTGQDRTFAEGIIIIGENEFRACAGSVLEPEPGQRVGALCVLDTKPRQFSADVLARLEDLAKAASALLLAARTKRVLKRKVDKLHAQERQLQHAVERDALTSLMNPVAFRIHVQRALALCGPEEGAIAVVDVDHFKQVNDGLGHPFGDLYLRAVASALAAAAGVTGLAGRMGGDEFALFLPGSEKDVAAQCAALLQEVAHRARALGHPELGGLSIGFYERLQEPGCDFETLYRKADIALYAAKRAGRGQVRKFSADLQPQAARIKQRSRFAAALKAGDIQPYFQPQVCLSKGRVVAFEALARWVDADGIVQRPVDFQAMLNDRSVGPELTRQMLKRSIEAQRRWRSAGVPPVALGINLSIHDLSRDGLIRDADGWIRQAGLAWSDFIFEITEMVVMGDLDREVYASMRRISQLGGVIALDDFGTGFAGLAHLRNWPVDIVKLDKSFVDGLLDKPRDEAIVASMLSLAKTLCIRTVAEGVENAGQAVRLRQMGCDKAQGYYFSPAMDEEGALALLTNSKGLLRRA